MNLQEHIRKVLKEYWEKPKQDNTEVEKIINKVMSKKFYWWKNIIIEEFSYSGMEPHSLTIYGTIEVDEEWASERWSEVYDYMPFSQTFDMSMFGDLLTQEYAKKLSDFMVMLLTSVTEYSPIDYVRMGQLKVKFV
jgi:hypothetical protein